jgi:hypothetical protein
MKNYFKEMIKSSLVFKCEFIKKNGEVREMIATFEEDHPTSSNLIIVFDIVKDSIRIVNIDTLLSLTINKTNLKINRL